MSNDDMNQAETIETWNQQVEAMAQQIDFPPTPDIAGAVHERLTVRTRKTPRYRYAAALIALIFIAALLIPDVRAAARRFLQIGAVQIVEETPTFDVETLATQLQISGGVSLDEAKTRFAKPLPDFPDEPDWVFMPDAASRVVLVWMQDGQPISLHVIESRNTVLKYLDNPFVEVTLAPGQDAIWLQDPHLIDFLDGEQRIVEDNVLLWESDGLTYRLESKLSLEDALDFARQLH